MSGIQTIGQRYAQTAWNSVQARLQRHKELHAAEEKERKNQDKPTSSSTAAPNDSVLAQDTRSKRYRARCRSLPVMIHQCGLAQTLAFCQSRNSKNGDPHLYGAWLQDLAHITGQSPESLAKKSRETDLQTYMHLTHQVLHAASWLKNYAEALIERGDDNDDGRDEE
jgi:CRISPR-associated protein Cmr5